MTDKTSFFLDNVEQDQPFLNYAVALQKAAASVGFDWPDIDGIIGKIHEEADEVAAELVGADPTRLHEEIGDLLFAVTNLARHLNVDPQKALMHANQKFQERFKYIEIQLKDRHKNLQSTTLDEMDKLWEESKR